MTTPDIDTRLLDRIDQADARLREVEEALADPVVLSDPDRIRVLGQQRAELVDTVRVGLELRQVMEELKGARELAAEADDPEMRELAAAEVEELEPRLPALAATVRGLLIPKDPMENRAAVVEVRAGTGGDEAGLFAGELTRMYERMAERAGWKVAVLSVSEGIPGAIKEAIFEVRGRGAFGQLRYESGVHRVQRVPSTESQGRIHTSAATVAVLPEAEEVDLSIDPNDLRVDVFRSSGPGGQSVNTTDSAVRITHVPSGLVVTCQDEKSQHKNKAKAMKVLRSRLLDQMIAESEAERAANRRSQVGTGDRSQKIRTYNFPQNRVTDHRIGLTVYNVEGVLDGDLSEFIAALRLAREEERIAGEGDSPGPAEG